MKGWTRVRWMRRRILVDGEPYTITLMAPWYIPLWAMYLWSRRGLVREAREQRIPRARVV